MSNWKQMLSFGAVVLVGLVIAYGVGRLQTASAIQGAERRIEVLASASTQGLETCEARRAVEHALVERLEARRALHLALVAIDEHNFGTAQVEIQNASRRLAVALGGSDKDLATLSEQLGSLHLVATEDVGEQRTRLLAMAKKFDQLVPPR